MGRGRGGEYDGRKYYCFAASRICRRPCHLIVSALQFKKSVALATKPMSEACYKKRRHCVVAGPRQTDKLCSTLLKLKVLFTYTQL